MDATDLRGQSRREERLDREGFHLFAISSMIEALRNEPEYDDNGRNGLLLLKLDHLRAVLEVARSGTLIGEHAIAGPTVIHVIEGSIRAESGDEHRIAHAGEMIVVPHDRARTLWADEDAAFLWLLSLEDREEPLQAG